MHDDREAPGPIHSLLSARFSPDQFDPSTTIDDHSRDLLLEAARWAPSAGNSQPWAFFTTRRGDREYEQVVRHLARSSARWATDAGLLVVTLARRHLGDPQLPYSEFADYDLGQAVAHLTIQAQALGLATHQFRAFDLEGLTVELRANPGWAIVSMIAVGKALGGRSENRIRRSIADLRTAPWSRSQ